MRISGLGDFMFGYYPNAANAVHQALNLNAAATWGAFSFFLKSGQTLTNLRLYFTVTGTVSAGEIQVDIYSDNAGAPNASLSNATNAGALSTGWTDFTFNQALTAHTQYWVVIRNLNATPASNYVTLRWVANGGPCYFPANASGTNWMWGKKHSTDSGATWAGAAHYHIVPSMRLDFSGSLYAGLPVESALTDTTNAVYSSREVGILFTTPQYMRMNVTGVTFGIVKAGSPTGNPRYRIYKGTTLVATTQEIPNASVTSLNGSHAAYFTTPVTLEPNTQYRVVMGESTQSDTSGNSWRLQFYTIDNTAASLALKPYGGTVQKTYYNGSSWAETATDFCPMALVLDQDSMYSPLGTDFAY